MKYIQKVLKNAYVLMALAESVETVKFVQVAELTHKLNNVFLVADQIKYYKVVFVYVLLDLVEMDQEDVQIVHRPQAHSFQMDIVFCAQVIKLLLVEYVVVQMA